MAKLSARHAAIAQPVERILGKDEVASSNLASSSKESVIPIGMADFSFIQWTRRSHIAILQIGKCRQDRGKVDGFSGC